MLCLKPTLPDFRLVEWAFLFLVTERRYSFYRRLFLRIHKPKPQTNTRGATPIITATGWFIKGFGGIVKSLQSMKPRKIIENHKKTVRAILGFAVGVVMVRNPPLAASFPKTSRTSRTTLRTSRENRNK